MNVHWKDWCLSWSSNTLATWCEELTQWKRPRRKTEGRRRRGKLRMRWLDGITSSMTWVWGNSGSWWWMGKLQSMGLQSGKWLSNELILTVTCFGFLVEALTFKVLPVSSYEHYFGSPRVEFSPHVCLHLAFYLPFRQNSQKSSVTHQR